MMQVRIITIIAVCFSVPILQTVSYIHSDKSTKTDVDFQTNFISDPSISTFKENFIKLKILEHDQEFESLTFCFRVQFSTNIQHCLFGQNIFFSFVEKNYGFLHFHKGMYVMYELNENVVPFKWYHICASYAQHHIRMVVNNYVAINEANQQLKSPNISNITLQANLDIGYCSESIFANEPLIGITRGILTDFNIWSKALTAKEMEKFTKDCKLPMYAPDLFIWNQNQAQRIINTNPNRYIK